MILYKGAGPGTHWHSNNAQLTGFSATAAMVANGSSALLHIIQGSIPSPYISFTTSFAVACKYALTGPAGIATAANPGYVYEIDTVISPVNLTDPIAVISGMATPARYAHEHDGGVDLILGIASPTTHGAILSASPRTPRNLAHAPTISPTLQGLIFAIRDAELLAQSVPAACIRQLHRVA